MIKKLAAAAFAAALALAPAPGHASVMGFKNGGDLLKNCVGDEEGLTKCHAYIAGVADVMSSLQADGSSFADRRACFPSHVNLGDLHLAFFRYLTAHLEEKTVLASDVVANALAKAYPCPKS